MGANLKDRVSRLAAEMRKKCQDQPSAEVAAKMAIFRRMLDVLQEMLPSDRTHPVLSPCGKHYEIKFAKDWKSWLMKARELGQRYAEGTLTDHDRAVVAALPEGSEELMYLLNIDPV